MTARRPTYRDLARMMEAAKWIARCAPEDSESCIIRAARRALARGILLTRAELEAAASQTPAHEWEDTIGLRRSYAERYECERGHYDSASSHRRCLWALRQTVADGLRAVGRSTNVRFEATYEESLPAEPIYRRGVF